MKDRRVLVRVPASVALTALIVLTLVLTKEFNRASALATQGGRDEVRLELSNNGFAPSHVQHSPGTFAIAVENSALSGEYTLRLKAEDGTVLKEVKVQKGSSAWTVTLQSGRYTLTETDHPQWTCSIVVQ